MFSPGGIGQVAKGVNAQGGLYALLKSSKTWFLESGTSVYKNLPPPLVSVPFVRSPKMMKNWSLSRNGISSYFFRPTLKIIFPGALYDSVPPIIVVTSMFRVESKGI